MTWHHGRTSSQSCASCRKNHNEFSSRSQLLPVKYPSFIVILSSSLTLLLHRGGAGDLLLLHLVYPGPLRLPYLLSSLQPHHKWRCKSLRAILYELNSWLFEWSGCSFHVSTVQIKGSWSSKRAAEESGNPYSYNSIITNCCVTLCGPMPPRWVKKSPRVSPASITIHVPRAIKSAVT